MQSRFVFGLLVLAACAPVSAIEDSEPHFAIDVIATLDGSTWGEANDIGLGDFGFCAADVDGDGHDDLVVGAPYSNQPNEWGGAVLAYSIARRANVWSIHGERMENLGGGLASVDDVDGDGREELVVSDSVFSTRTKSRIATCPMLDGYEPIGVAKFMRVPSSAGASLIATRVVRSKSDRSTVLAMYSCDSDTWIRSVRIDGIDSYGQPVVDVRFESASPAVVLLTKEGLHCVVLGSVATQFQAATLTPWGPTRPNDLFQPGKWTTMDGDSSIDSTRTIVIADEGEIRSYGIRDCDLRARRQFERGDPAVNLDVCMIGDVTGDEVRDVIAHRQGSSSLDLLSGANLETLATIDTVAELGVAGVKRCGWIEADSESPCLVVSGFDARDGREIVVLASLRSSR